jgi:hypothetical protein
MFTISRAQNRSLKKQKINTDDNGYHRQNVKHNRRVSAHVNHRLKIYWRQLKWQISVQVGMPRPQSIFEI